MFALAGTLCTRNPPAPTGLSPSQSPILQAAETFEIQRKDLKDLVTRGLSRAERLILILYYYEEMTMKEIGLTLDLSESRVS